MRNDIEVSVPVSDGFSYTLFAQGLQSALPYTDKDGKSVVFTFRKGSVFALFYTFGEFRRAYLVTQADSGKCTEKSYLPGVSCPVRIITSCRGRKIDRLKYVLHILTKEAHYAPFRLPVRFWEKISFLTESGKCFRENVFFLYGKYSGKRRKP